MVERIFRPNARRESNKNPASAKRSDRGWLGCEEIAAPIYSSLVVVVVMDDDFFLLVAAEGTIFVLFDYGLMVAIAVILVDDGRVLGLHRHRERNAGN
jgi:hypothetical protein